MLCGVATTAAQEAAVAPSPQSSTGAAQPPEGFFRALGHDFLRLPSPTNAILLGIGGGMALGVHSADAHLTQQAYASAPLDFVFDAGDALGSGWAEAGGAAATFLIGHALNKPRVQAVGSELVRAQILNAALTEGLKVAVRRNRPDGSLFSFPSGHASATFASATVLYRQFGWKAGLPAYGAAVYVAGSRLTENRHYASDVIFGAAVGIVAGRTVMIGHGAKRFSVSPVAGRGAAAIVLTRVTP